MLPEINNKNELLPSMMYPSGVRSQEKSVPILYAYENCAFAHDVGVENNIDALRRSRKLTVDQLAEMIGTTRGMLNKLKSGERRLNSDWINKLAKALNCDPGDIFKRKGVAESTQAYRALEVPKKKMIPVVGHVGAGGEVVYIDAGEKGAAFDEIEVPEGVKEGAVALRVRGDSMEPVFREGDTIIMEGLCPTVGACVGEDCVVRLRDGRTLLKKLLKGNAIGLFNLKSYNDEYPIMMDVGIEWARKVVWVRRR